MALNAGQCVAGASCIICSPQLCVSSVLLWSRCCDEGQRSTMTRSEAAKVVWKYVKDKALQVSMLPV